MGALPARALVLAALLALTASCSWGTVTGPPPHTTPSAHPGCTSSSRPLKVDGTFAAIFGGAGIAGLGALAGGCDNVACMAVALGGLVAALPFALSYDYGRRRVDACREVDLTWRAQEHAREEAREGRRGGRPGPGRRPPPATPASRPASQPASQPASAPALAPAPVPAPLPVPAPAPVR